ncbi:MAG: gamma-glutamyltransferase [Gammaproteobacteria bacterium]|nr:gamma-glutamyltransferase [Gammaproteobacteria bacterium]
MRLKIKLTVGRRGVCAGIALCWLAAGTVATAGAAESAATGGTVATAGSAEFSEAGVASAAPLATAAGLEILEKGGNAFDAAVAVSAALAVVEPAGSGLGGGGFWLLHDAATGANVMLDGREKAPLAATRDMYLDAAGAVVAGLSINGALAAGIPGQPAALVWLAENRGQLRLAESLAPAIRLAENGFAVTAKYRRQIKFRLEAVQASPAAAAIFLVDGQPPAEGAVIVQRDLAATLRALAARGRDGFYAGAVARKLVAGVRAAGGIWTLEDLRAYHVQLRAPVTVEYRGMKITSAALPSSGGLVLAQAFNILAGYDLDASALDGADAAHWIVEALRRAYRDRAEYMGDADFVEVPVAMLQSRRYAAGLRQSIRMDRATPSAALRPTAPASAASTAPATGSQAGEGADTTHFSVIDAAGNRVAATLSINYPFGSGLAPPGTGVLLNDEMDDFSAKPGAPNVYGLVGAEANAIAGGKRMLSSMSPTFLEANGRVAALGTPGGSRIISMVLLAALEFRRGADAAAIVARPRFHHQYLPDAVQFEPGALADAVADSLRARGHTLDAKQRTWGNMHIVIRGRDRRIDAASDPRGEGAARILRGGKP